MSSRLFACCHFWRFHSSGSLLRRRCSLSLRVLPSSNPRVDGFQNIIAGFLWRDLSGLACSSESCFTWALWTCCHRLGVFLIFSIWCLAFFGLRLFHPPSLVS